MAASFGIEYPLQRDGNSQAQRNIEARNPATAPLEGRNVLELLYFWSRYAKVVIYHGENKSERDWSPFFERSVPFKLAEIYHFDPEQWWTTYQTFRSKVNAADGLELVLGHLFGAFERHQNWLSVLEFDVSAVGQTIKSLTSTNLNVILPEFIGMFNTLKNKHDVAVRQNVGIFTDAEANRIWQLQAEEITGTDASLASKIGNRITLLPHILPRLDRFAEILYKAQIAMKAAYPAANDDAGMEKLIANDGEHEPLVGLMLAFLRIFREVQHDLNRITQRHLDFFYRDVLQLAEKAANPDLAHLIFELARHVPTYKMASETAIKDGKDNNKAEIIFQTSDELIVNRAAVADLRTLFTAQLPVADVLTTCPPEIISPAGELAKPLVLTGAQSNFAPFGSRTEMPGRLGFVLSSPVFRMAEGTRDVEVDLHFSAPLDAGINYPPFFRLQITTKDKWLDVDSPQVFIAAPGTPHILRIKFQLPAEFKPIAPLPDPKLNPFGSENPLLKVLFDVSQPTFGDFYIQLSQKNLIEITARVIVNGVRNQLVLKNDESNLDAKKPFQPFGTAAKYRFYVSHPDFAGKTLHALKYHMVLDDKAKNIELNRIYDIFYGGTLFNRTGVLLSSRQTDSDLSEAVPFLNPSIQLFALNNNDTQIEIDPLLAGSSIAFGDSGGYIAMRVNGDAFLHDQYPSVLLMQSHSARVYPGTRLPDAYYRQRFASYDLVKGSNIPPPHTITSALFQSLYDVAFPQEPPYNPVVQSFVVEYHASETLAGFIQLLPFEDASEAVTIGAIIPSTETMSRLVPVIQKEGHLYIGLKDAPVNGNVALLFQFSEYTGDADLKMPEMEWSVLTTGHRWKVLKRDIDFSDDTGKFVQSGVIRFELPENASLEHTILPAGMVWLRATIANRAAAFDRLLGVHAQAVKAIFAPSLENDLSRLDQGLAAGSLKKFVQETASISKLGQPYPSFGGRNRESEDAYYRRISERLRHKGRAINLWDYEMLVLEAFPQIYKVKCLNHTLGLRGMSQDFEYLNGHVTLVVVPDVRQLAKEQRETPKANQNLLQDIRTFLQERVSPFAQFQVLNPRYEFIHTKFSVRFFPGKDDAYYQQTLETELKDFLSPWRSDPPAEIQFGGEVYRSSLIRFIELREYVDYVTDFEMLTGPSGNVNRITAQTARSVLAAGVATIQVIGN
ncbi:MAG: baseplate J/gp47 family protein [Saprospiraceae bacterium]